MKKGRVLGLSKSRSTAQLAGGAAVQVEKPDPAALLEGHPAEAARGPEHVEIRETGQLLDLFALQVIGIEIEHQVAVGDEVDPVLVPERVLVGAGEVGQPFGNVLLQVVGPDVLGPAALGALPGAELARDRGVDDRAVVGREPAAAAFRDLQGLLQAAAERDQEVFSHPFPPGGAVGAHHDLPRVGGPVQHHVVVAAARGHDAGVVVEGELAGRAARGRDDVDLARAGVFGRIGDPLAVRGDLGKEFQAGVVGQLAGRAARGRDRPDVAGVDEDHQVLVHVGKAQQPGVLQGERRGAQQQTDCEHGNYFLHGSSFFVQNFSHRPGRGPFPQYCTGRVAEKSKKMISFSKK